MFRNPVCGNDFNWSEVRNVIDFEMENMFKHYYLSWKVWNSISWQYLKRTLICNLISKAILWAITVYNEISPVTAYPHVLWQDPGRWLDVAGSDVTWEFLHMSDPPGPSQYSFCSRFLLEHWFSKGGGDYIHILESLFVISQVQPRNMHIQVLCPDDNGSHFQKYWAHREHGILQAQKCLRVACF